MRGSLLTAVVYFAGSLFFVVGCDSSKDFKPVDPNKNKTADKIDHAHDHDHGHSHGPHEGHIVELGNEEYHGEVVFDAKTNTVGIYLYGPDLKKPQPIEAKTVTLNLKLEGKPLQLALNAKPLDTEKDGKSSYFELKDNAELKEHAKSIEDLEGKLQVEINGKSYSGNVGHAEGGDHDHDHGHNHDEHDHDHDKEAGSEGSK